MEAWRRLHFEYAPISTKGRRRLMRQVIVPKQASRKDYWKELNTDGHPVGTCNSAICVERYQMEIDAQAGHSSCMSLLSRLDEGAVTRCTAKQVWEDPKPDCRKSEVWNYLKLSNHVREEIEAYLTSIEFLDTWEDYEKNN